MEAKSRPTQINELVEAVFGDAPLESIDHHFESREELLQFYADEMEAMYSKNKSSLCEFCDLRVRDDAGSCRLDWYTVVKVFRFKIALTSTILLPVLMLLQLTHIHHLVHYLFRKQLDIQTGVAVGFSTHHAICRSCWGRQRRRLAATLAMQYAVGLPMAINFMLAPVVGSYAIACQFQWFGLSSADAILSGLIAIAMGLAGINLWYIGACVIPIFMAPPTHRRLAKAPFSFGNVALIPLTQIDR